MNTVYFTMLYDMYDMRKMKENGIQLLLQASEDKKNDTPGESIAAKENDI